MRKLFICSMMVLFSAGLLFAAGEKEAEEKKELNFAFSIPLAGEAYYQTLENTMRDTVPLIEEKTGMKVNLDVARAESDVSKQVADFETFISKGVDVILVGSIDKEVSKQLIKEAHDAGIPVVTMGLFCENAEDVYMTRDNYDVGYQAGVATGKYVKKNWNSKGIIGKVLVVGFPSLPTCVQRVQGYYDGLDEVGAKYEKTVEVDGQGIMSTSLEVSTDALTAHPDVNMLYGINNDSTFGAYEAAKAQGFDVENMVVSSIGFYREEAIDFIQTRDNYFDIACFPSFSGYLNIHYMAALALGLIERNPDGTALIGTIASIAVDRDNFEDLYYYEDRSWKENFDGIAKILVKLGGVAPEVINLKK